MIMVVVVVVVVTVVVITLLNVIPPIVTDGTVVCSVCLCHLSHSCTLIKLLDGMRWPFGRDTYVVPSNVV